MRMSQCTCRAISSCAGCLSVCRLATRPGFSRQNFSVSPRAAAWLVVTVVRPNLSLSSSSHWSTSDGTVSTRNRFTSHAAARGDTEGFWRENPGLVASLPPHA